jgi:hypothetical protein
MAAIALGYLFAFIPGVAAQAAKRAGVDKAIVEEIRGLAYDKALVAANIVNSKVLNLPPREWPDVALCEKFADEAEPA